MYADTITPSMAKAIDETNRRRAKQVAYNEAHGVDPTPLRKKIADITDLISRGGRRHRGAARRLRAAPRAAGKAPVPGMALGARRRVGRSTRRACRRASWPSSSSSSPTRCTRPRPSCSSRWRPGYRDEVSDLKKELRQMQAAGHA